MGNMGIGRFSMTGMGRKAKEDIYVLRLLKLSKDTVTRV